MFSRTGLRFFASARQQFARPGLRNAFKRQQTTASNPAAEVPPQGVFQRLWTSEVGIKTVHFWCVHYFPFASATNWHPVLGIIDVCGMATMEVVIYTVLTKRSQGTDHEMGRRPRWRF